jgi:zinc D-Ala-D-Ala carboxypeptidase
MTDLAKEYFTDDELRCKCGCFSYFFDQDARIALNHIREECGFPFIITSACRCAEHPLEVNKRSTGAHTYGKAVDIAVRSDKAIRVLEVAIAHGVKRIGVHQKGTAKFIHLDWCDELPSPALWTY